MLPNLYLRPAHPLPPLRLRYMRPSWGLLVWPRPRRPRIPRRDPLPYRPGTKQQPLLVRRSAPWRDLHRGDGRAQGVRRLSRRRW